MVISDFLSFSLTIIMSLKRKAPSDNLNSDFCDFLIGKYFIKILFLKIWKTLLVGIWINMSNLINQQYLSPLNIVR